MPTVLVVEDHPANMKLVVLLLEKAGYAVLQADDAERGLALAREHRPDLVLMDIQLPGVDGLAATRRLKADPQTAGIKVVALTAFAMTGDERRVFDAGCDDYISKPVRYRELLDAVQRQLAGA